MIKYILMILLLVLFSACQKQSLELSNIDQPRDAVQYNKDIKLHP